MPRGCRPRPPRNSDRTLRWTPCSRSAAPATSSARTSAATPTWSGRHAAIAALYGFDEWATPIFEDTRVFSRTLGDTSDVVTKEMYSFDDRGGDSVTLRPEGTAGVCRALVSNGLTQSLPQKVFYAGPMFRYERPQKGRYRQFHQIGAELIGPSEPLADAEVIALGRDILRALGIAGRRCSS